MENLYVVKEDHLLQMSVEIENNDFYDQGTHWEFQPANLLPSAVRPKSEVPSLAASAKNDAESSIQIYRYLGTLSRTQATDVRIWVYLTHAVFAPYVRERWGVDGIRSRWFVEGGLRGLRRNAISTLWWGAYLTYAGCNAPGTTEHPDTVEALGNDPFCYTRVLFSNQDIYHGLMERLLGLNAKVRIAILECLRMHQSKITSDRVQEFYKQLNRLSYYNYLPILPFSNLVLIFNRTWASVCKE